jgi:choline dehydrogenase-like flavoprotein
VQDQYADQYVLANGFGQLAMRDIQEAEAYEADRHGLYAPAVLRRNLEAQRDEELYRRAVAEHDEQEMARILIQIEAREVTEQARRQALEAQRQAAHERQAVAAAATTRARGLLLENLSPEQRETFEANGWFIVEGGRTKTRYRVNGRSYQGNIDVLRGHDSRVTHRLCGHAPSHIPLGDQLLAQKIMLELAEDDFLRIANRTNVA